MKTSELRTKGPVELQRELAEAERRLFELRMDLATRKLTSHRQIREARRLVARLQTLIREGAAPAAEEAEDA